MAPLFSHLSLERVHTYSLILSSAGISHHIDQKNRQWRITVADDQRRSALKAVALYLKENKSEAAAAASPAIFSNTHIFSAVYAAVLLITCHLAIGYQDQFQAYLATFGADARSIMSGEVYRCVTALFMHANWAHLLANVAGIILFGIPTAALYGWGMSWLLIVLAGAQGNFITAWWYQSNHMSIGASTAVFAALGLCAAWSFRRRLGRRGNRWRPWLPLAGGLALVAWLGTAPHTDVIAHLSGFASGLFYGGVYSWHVRATGRRWLQSLALSVLAGILLISWAWAPHYSG